MWISRLDRKEIIAFVGLNFGGIVMFLTMLSAAPSPSRFIVQVIAILQIAGAALFVLYRMRQMRRGGDVVCTTRQGVWIKKGRRVELYPWAEIEGVFWNSANKSAGLDIKGRTRPLYISGVLRSQTVFEELRMAMRRRKQVAEEESCSGS